MQLTILGGGGFRVPLVYQALCDDPELGVTDLILYDVDGSRLGLTASILSHIGDQAARSGHRVPRVRTSTDLAEAVRGAAFVFSAIRVGGLAGRVSDERCALDHGVLGQETTGAGGITYGLRTVPVAVAVAEVIATEAPQAWVINFTNPAGMVTEAMRSRLGDRVVGICDSPVGLFRRVAKVLDVDPERAEFDYSGLNHLGWLHRVLIDGADVLPGLLGDHERLSRIEEGRLFGAEWLQTLGSFPNEYLWYWYFRSDALSAERATDQTRGEFLLTQQQGFYTEAARLQPTAAYQSWQATRRHREESYMADSREVSGSGERDEDDLDGGGYDRVALAVMRAISSDRPTRLVLNVANRGTFTFLDDQAVIEVPCVISGSGISMTQVSQPDLHGQGLVASVKAVERLVIEAALTGSRSTAVEALALHPLVGSVPVARGILDDQLGRVPELAQIIRR
jgi:6-phospho-beta-glucosidase